MEKKRKADRERKALSRKTESVKEREARLAKVREQAKKRRENETGEERDLRLGGLRVKSQQRRQSEDEGERENRLECLRGQAQQRRQAEDDGERETRLASLRGQAQQRRQSEDEGERETRLECMRGQAQQRRQAEDDGERETRVASLRGQAQQRRQVETEEARIDRLRKDKEGKAEKRAKNGNECLAKCFENKMKLLDFSTCSVCKRTDMEFFSREKCSHCSKNPAVNSYTANNSMDPGEVPEELKNLSPLEELLIAKVHPVISLYRTRGRQMHYSGHVINFPQDVKSFCNKLPNIKAATDSIIVVRKKGEGNHEHVDFRVSGLRILTALKWLKENNHYYSDIEIDTESISSLPDEGNLFESLSTVEVDSQKEDDGDEGVVTTGVPVLPNENQEKQIKTALQTEIPWPTIENSAIDEFRTAGYIATAFPTLFPTGDADLRQGRLKKVGDTDYFKFLMMYSDGRFARHSRFPFFALNSTLRWSALNQGRMFVKKNLAGKTLQDLKNLLLSDKTLTNRIIFFGSSIRGTKAYWFRRCGELLAMVEQFGTPTIFFTLSAADLQWPDLYRLLKPGVPIDEISNSERVILMSDNPYIVASFFETRGSLFIESVLKKKFNVEDMWFRYEWQHRGSPHIHGLLWIKDSPRVDDILKKSEEYKQSVMDYFDNLVSTMNPDKTLAPLNFHPCQVRLESLAGEEDELDLTRLLNKIQRHTKCSANYCLRKKKGSGKLECRFRFPIEERDATEIVLDHTGNPRIMTKRNDDRLNIHNPFVTKLWRANTDFQPIMSRQAVINYIAKYASKCEPQSESYKEMISSIVGGGNNDEPARKAVQKLLMRTVAERDYSAQEVVHTLMGYPMYHSSRQFVTLNLKMDGWIPLQGNKNETDGSNFVEKYQNRDTTFEDENLFQFARKYYYKSGKCVKRRKEAAVQVYPKLKLNGESNKDQRENFFRQKVLLYLPWRNEEDVRSIYDSWEDCFNINRLQMFPVSLSIEDADDDEFEEQEEEEPLQEIEEFMVASKDGPNRILTGVELGNREIDLEYNWSCSYDKYDSEEFVNFLSDSKKEEENEDRIYEYPNVELTKQQKEVVDVLDEQIRSLKLNKEPDIKRTIVQGKGGSGKSTVINYMTARLSEEFGSGSFKVMAPTGSAAVNIGGSTIHSTLGIGISAEIETLTGETLRNFQTIMKDVKFMVFDEFSMIGSRLIGKIDKRCREAKPEKSHEVFGGMCIFFLGDIKQLPPVMDRAPYSKGMFSGISLNGRIAYFSFQKCIVLGDSQRQAGNDKSQVEFRELLDRLSKGQSSVEDWRKLEARSSSRILKFKESFGDALRLFPTNELAQNYNQKKLLELNRPIARCEGKHNCPEAEKGSSDSAQGLSKKLYLAIGARIMLKSNLWTSKGLVNGTLGTVEDIVFRPEENPSNSVPVAVLVKWENYSGPTLRDTGLFPLVPVTRYWMEKGKSCARTQFPITLAWAITIHKSQGMTLTKGVVDIGEQEFSAGLSYVAISRMKNYEGLAIDPPFGYERLQKIGKSLQLKERIMEEDRLSKLH